MNIIYKLLAEAANVEKVEYGQEISIDIDLALAHDGSMLKIIDEVNKLPLDQKLSYIKKLHVAMDHYFPAPNIEARENYKRIKKFCNKHGIHIYNNGQGIIHQIIGEKFASTLKDKILVGVDGHMCTLSGLGAIPFSITADEMASVLISGKYTLAVPEVINLELTGRLDYGNSKKILPTGKDIGLFLIRELGIGNLKERAILLGGSIFQDISESQKMTTGNMLGEIGGKTVYFVDGNIMEEDKLSLNYNEMENLLALPGSLENIVNIGEIDEINLTQVYIGGCTNGRIDDMGQVAEALFNKEVHPDVTLIVCPASRQVANEMDRLGYSQVIRESGGTIISPGCGACSGIHQGVISSDDVVVTTTPRNRSGRMGDPHGLIYLCSPKLAASFAVKGKISGEY